MPVVGLEKVDLILVQEVKLEALEQAVGRHWLKEEWPKLAYEVAEEVLCYQMNEVDCCCNEVLEGHIPRNPLQVELRLNDLVLQVWVGCRFVS